MLVNSRDLAVMGATLANGGVNPQTGQRAIEQSYVKYLLSIMLSCGMYDYAGEWAYRVGIPSKSGVSGGIVGVVPGQFGIGVYSPPLDSKGTASAAFRFSESFPNDLVYTFLKRGSAARRFETSSRQYVVVSPDLDEQDNSFRSFAGNRFPWTLYEMYLVVL